MKSVNVLSRLLSGSLVLILTLLALAPEKCWSQNKPWRSYDLLNELGRLTTPQERVAHFVRRFPSFEPSKIQDVQHFETDIIQLIMLGGRVLLETDTHSAKLSFYGAEPSQKFAGWVTQSEHRVIHYENALHLSGNRYLVMTDSGSREVTGSEDIMPPGSISHGETTYSNRQGELTVRLRPFHSRYPSYDTPEYGFVMQVVLRTAGGGETVAYESTPEETPGPVIYAQFDAKHPEERFQIAYQQEEASKLPYNIGETRRYSAHVQTFNASTSQIYILEAVESSQRTVPVATFEGLGDPATPLSRSGRSSTRICRSLFAL